MKPAGFLIAAQNGPFIWLLDGVIQPVTEFITHRVELQDSGSNKSRARTYLGLEIARKAGHVPLGTFDKRFSHLDGVQRVS